MLDPPWSLERGLSILADGDSPEARLLDAMDLLVGFHAESEDAVIGPVETQLVSGRTELIRTKAASSLVLLMSPAGFGTLESSLPGLDEETRGFAERLLNVPGVTKARAGKAMSERSLERHRHHTSKRIEKVSRLTRRRQEKLRRGLMRFDVNVDDLEREPVVSPDLAPGGIGYRLDFVPRNEQAATFTIWVGANGIRFAVGPRQASLTQTWATGLGRRFRTFGAGSYLDAVRGGKVTERVDPNGRESVARLPLAAGNTEDFKTSSEVPNPEAIPADWTEIVYAGF